VIKIWANLIKFGQNQNLISPRTFDFLRICFRNLIILTNSSLVKKIH